jgi:hypothetical protein
MHQVRPPQQFAARSGDAARAKPMVAISEGLTASGKAVSFNRAHVLILARSSCGYCWKRMLVSGGNHGS